MSKATPRSVRRSTKSTRSHATPDGWDGEWIISENQFGPSPDDARWLAERNETWDSAVPNPDPEFTPSHAAVDPFDDDLDADLIGIDFDALAAESECQARIEAGISPF